MSETIGSVDLRVGLDGSSIARQARRIGNRVSRQLSESFNLSFDKGLGNLSAQMAAAGRRNGTLFSEKFRTTVGRDIRSHARGLQDALSRAISHRDGWNAYVNDVGGADNAVRKLAETVEFLRNEEFKVMKQRADGVEQEYWYKVLPDKDADRILKQIRQWGEESKKLEKDQLALVQATEKLDIARDRLSRTIGNNEDFRRYVKEVGDADTATDNLRRGLTGLRDEGALTERQFAKLSDELDRQKIRFDEHNERLSRTAVVTRNSTRRTNALARAFSSLGDKLKNFGNRGDLTPRIIVAIILTLGESIASLLSGASAAITAMLSSVALAVGGLAVSILPAIAGIGGAIGLAINSFRFMREEVSSVDHALENLSRTSEASGRRFARAWGPSVADFLTQLNVVLGDTAIIDKFAESMTGITNAFSNVLSSPGFTSFREQLITNIPEGLEKLGVAAAKIFEGLIGLATAAAPYFNDLMESFSGWAIAWSGRMTDLENSTGFQDFMGKAVESIKQVISTVDSLGDFLGTVFVAGADSGNRLLKTLEKVFRSWDNWAKSIEGQASLEQWFKNGERIMGAFGDLLVDTGKMFAQVVTPDSIDRMEEFMGRLGDMMPGLGELIILFGELDILNVVAVLLQTVGAALEPLMPTLHDLAGLLSSTLKDGLQNLQEPMSRLGEALVPVIELLVNLAVAIIPLVSDALVDIIDISAAFIGIIGGVADAVNGEYSSSILKFGELGHRVLMALGIDMSHMEVSAEELDASFDKSFTNMRQGGLDLAADFHKAGDDMGGVMGGLISFAGDVAKNLTESFFKVDESLGKTDKATISTREQFELMDKKSQRTGQEIDDLASKIRNFGSDTLNSREAARNYEAALDRVTESLAASGNTLDITTEKGRENEANIDRLVRATLEHSASILEETGSQERANEVLNKGRENMLKMIEGFDLGGVSAEEYADSLGLIPQSVSTKIETPGLSSAQKAMNNFYQSILNIPSSKTVRVGTAAVGQGPIAFARGGNVFGPTRALIGEAGPEAVVPLRRPLNQVDPSVRWLSAIAQGRQMPHMASGGVAGAGNSVTVESGAIVVQEAGSAIQTSVAILDRIAENL